MSDESVTIRCGASTLSRDGVNIRWKPTDADRKRAEKNHYQTLERLAERGGLAWSEFVAILEDRAFEPMDADAARRAVHSILTDRANNLLPSAQPAKD